MTKRVGGSLKIDGRSAVGRASAKVRQRALDDRFEQTQLAVSLQPLAQVPDHEAGQCLGSLELQLSIRFGVDGCLTFVIHQHGHGDRTQRSNHEESCDQSSSHAATHTTLVLSQRGLTCFHAGSFEFVCACTIWTQLAELPDKCECLVQSCYGSLGVQRARVIDEPSHVAFEQAALTSHLVSVLPSADRICDVAGGHGALTRFPCHRLATDVAQLRRHGRRHPCECLCDCRCPSGVRDLRWARSRQKMKQRRAETVDVASLRDESSRKPACFRRHVARRSGDRDTLGGIHHGTATCQSPVEHDGFTESFQRDVGRFDVAVHEAGYMCVLNGVTYADERLE